MSIIGVLENHPGFAINKAGDRIRCDGTDCRAVLDIGSLTAGHLFASHLKQHLVPFDDELARLRNLGTHMRHLAKEMTDRDVPIYILAELDQVLDLAGIPALPVPPASPFTEEEPASDVNPQPPHEASPPEGKPVPESVDDPSPETTKRIEPKESTPMAAARRDIQELTETLATVKAGDRVRASFRMPRYGDFTVEGTVVKGKGSEHRQFNIGGSILGTHGKPSKFVQEMVVLASAGNHGYAIVPGSEEDKHFGQLAA